MVEKKGLPSSPEAKRALVRGDERLSVRRQCALLGLARSSFYYAPRGVSEEDLCLMRLIDQQYLCSRR